MTMRVKFISIFILTFLLFGSALIWRLDQVLFGEGNSQADTQNRLQISALLDAFDTETQNLSNILTLGLAEVEKNGGDYPAGSPYSRFQMMGSLTPPAEGGGDWQVSNAHYLEKSETKSWATSYIALVLKAVKPADFKMGSVQVVAVNDPKRNPYLLFVTRSIRQWHVGLMGTDVFQKLMDRQKGELQSVFLVNTQGQALGHTTSEYVGKLLTEDPIVSQIMKSAASSGGGSFKNLKQEEVKGYFEKIPMSNLYVVLTIPMAPMMAQQNEMRMQFGFMALGLCLVGLAIFLVLFKKEEEAPQAMLPPAMPMRPVVGSVINGTVGGNSGGKKSESEKSGAYTKMASTLSNELKQPLTSILGHVQLALKTVSDQKTIEHLNRAEREARAAREVIQKLVIFAGEDKVTFSPVSLDTILQKALKNLEGRFSIKGIKVQKQIESIPPFSMPAELVTRAIESVLTNAMEAMERAPQKNLSVNLSALGSEVILSIADTGQGMTADEIDRAFDPFYTTRAGSQHVGLGLSTAKSIVRQTAGDIEIQSEKGKGTKVIMTFKPQEVSLSQAETIPTAVPPAPEKEIEPVKKTLGTIAVFQDPILVDDSIEKLIDGAEPEEIQSSSSLEAKKITQASPESFPPSPAAEFQDEKTGDVLVDSDSQSEKTMILQSPAVEAPSVKIDKPQLDIKKKTSELDEAPVSIRRPGAKA